MTPINGGAMPRQCRRWFRRGGALGVFRESFTRVHARCTIQGDMARGRAKLFTLGVVAAGFLLLGAAVGCLQAQNPSDHNGWRPIFNGKNFEGWYTFLPSVGKNHDPNSVFKVEDGMIHVLDVEGKQPDTSGYLATIRNYGHVRVRLQYKFGPRHFGRRSPEARPDAGLLYYFFGPDNVWGNNLELQIQKQDVGDLWINGSVSVTSGVIAAGVPIWGGPFPFTIKSTFSTIHRRGMPPNLRRILKSGDFEHRDGWNTVEAVLDGDRVTHIVNGVIVFTGYNVRRRDASNPSRWIPLTAGKLCLEAEGSEVWYRNIDIKTIPYK